MPPASFFVTPTGKRNDFGDFFGLVRLAAAARDLSSARHPLAQKSADRRNSRMGQGCTGRERASSLRRWTIVPTSYAL